MKAIILAAGEGNRMHPLTYTRPKVMLPIANKPIIEHLLIEAKEAGIEEFVFIEKLPIQKAKKLVMNCMDHLKPEKILYVKNILTGTGLYLDYRVKKLFRLINKKNTTNEIKKLYLKEYPEVSSKDFDELILKLRELDVVNF